MKELFIPSRVLVLVAAFVLAVASAAFAQGNNPIIGIWRLDEGFQTRDYLFRSDGRYRLDTQSTDPAFGFSFKDTGRYELNGQTLTIRPDEYFGDPISKSYNVEITGDALSLISPDSGFSEVFQFRPGSRADVLAGEKVPADLVGTWARSIQFAGKEEYTFRPDGYYVLKNISEGE